MKKKLICVLLAGAMLITLPSCSAAGTLFTFFAALSSVQDNSEQSLENPAEDDSVWSSHKRVEKLAYDVLNPTCQTGSYPFGFYWLEKGTEQRLYKRIMEAAFYVAKERVEREDYFRLDTIICETSVSNVQFMKVLTAFMNDNPQVFWLCNQYDYVDSGGQRYFYLYSYLSADDCQQEQRRFYDTVKKIISGLPKKLSEFETEKYIHDYLLDHCAYFEGDRWWLYSAYGAIVQGKAVCEGYSEAMQLLLNCAGVRTTVVVGESGGNLHEWNLVQINFEWYHLDATWDDGDDSEESRDELSRYNYFNVDSAFIEDNDHVISPEYKDMTEEEIANEEGEYMKQFNLYLPDCVTMDANYYYYNAATITDLNIIEGKVLDRFISTLKNKNPYFYMRCGENIDFDSMDYNLFEDDLYYQYADAANGSGRTGGNRIINDKVRSFTLDGYDDLIIAQMEYVS